MEQTIDELHKNCTTTIAMGCKSIGDDGSKAIARALQTNTSVTQIELRREYASFRRCLHDKLIATRIQAMQSALVAPNRLPMH